MPDLALDDHKLHHHPERVASWLKGGEIIPVHVDISPTNYCNQRCVFCYAAYSGYTRGSLDRDVYLRLMRDMGSMGVKSCLLAGDGEPLIHKATPDAIVAAKQAGVDVSINTNAVLLTEAVARKVIPHLTWLRTGMMGATPETFAAIHKDKPENFHLVWKNIRKAAEIKRELRAQVTIGIQFILVPENAPEMYDVAAQAKGAGADYFVVKPFSQHPLNDYKPSDTSDLHVRYRDALEKTQALTDASFSSIVRWKTFSDKGERSYDRCLGLPFLSQIDCDGGVYTCCPYFGEEAHLLGNLNEKPFPEIWTSARKKEVIRRVEETLDVHKCMTFCRHHQINKYLWNLRHPPDHVNFI